MKKKEQISYLRDIEKHRIHVIGRYVGYSLDSWEVSCETNSERQTAIYTHIHYRIPVYENAKEWLYVSVFNIRVCY